MSSISSLRLHIRGRILGRWGEGSGASRIVVNLGVGELDVTLD